MADRRDDTDWNAWKVITPVATPGAGPAITGTGSAAPEAPKADRGLMDIVTAPENMMMLQTAGLATLCAFTFTWTFRKTRKRYMRDLDPEATEVDLSEGYRIAAKGLGIATVLTMSTFGMGVSATSLYLGATNLKDFHVKMRRVVHAKSVAIENWFKSWNPLPKVKGEVAAGTVPESAGAGAGDATVAAPATERQTENDASPS